MTHTVPRRSQRATPPPNGVAGHADEGHAEGEAGDADPPATHPSSPAPGEKDDLSPTPDTAPLPFPSERSRQALGVADPGLYALLGLSPDVSDAEIQTSYRRQAARLMSDAGSDRRTMRQLNTAYEVLGNPVRRAEYDRALRAALQTAYATQPAEAHQPLKGTGLRTTRRRPRQMVQTRTAGLPEVLVVIAVVALSILVGKVIIERVDINLSGLNVLSSVLALTTGPRRLTVEGTATPAPASAAAAVTKPVLAATPAPTAPPTPSPAAPTATVPALTDRFAGSTVTVSAQNPPQHTAESIIIRLRRDGQPAADVEVFANVQYRTTLERWPNQGTVRTDPNGAATITFNVGPATPGYNVQVQVFALADGEQVSWSTSFTPR